MKYETSDFPKQVCVLFFFFVCMVAGEAESPWRASVHTRVAAEGQFPCGCVGLRDAEIPVLVNAHRGSVGVPAGMGEEQILKARQHLRATGRNNSQGPRSSVTTTALVKASYND